MDWRRWPRCASSGAQAAREALEADPELPRQAGELETSRTDATATVTSAAASGRPAAPVRSAAGALAAPGAGDRLAGRGGRVRRRDDRQHRVPEHRAVVPGNADLSLSWVLNAYNIVFAAFLVAAGRIADLLGRRRMFVLGLELFTVASLLCAIAPSADALIAFRVCRRSARRCWSPPSLALVLNAFPPDRRAHGVALLSAVAAAAAGLGPSLGGLLVAADDWRLVFLVNLPIGIAAVVLARRQLVESRAPGRRRMPDLLGRGCCSRLASPRSCSASSRGRSGAGAARGIVGSFALAIVLGALFVWRCTWHRSPIIDLSLLRIRTFSAANAMTIVAAAGFYGYTLTNVLFLTGVWRYSVLAGRPGAHPGPVRRRRGGGPDEPPRPADRPPAGARRGRPDLGRGVMWFVETRGVDAGFPGRVASGDRAARDRRRHAVPQPERRRGRVGARRELRHRDRAELGRAPGRRGARRRGRGRDHRHAERRSTAAACSTTPGRSARPACSWPGSAACSSGGSPVERDPVAGAMPRGWCCASRLTSTPASAAAPGAPGDARRARARSGCRAAPSRSADFLAPRAAVRRARSVAAARRWRERVRRPRRGRRVAVPRGRAGRRDVRRAGRAPGGVRRASRQHSIRELGRGDALGELALLTALAALGLGPSRAGQRPAGDRARATSSSCWTASPALSLALNRASPSSCARPARAAPDDAAAAHDGRAGRAR